MFWLIAWILLSIFTGVIFYKTGDRPGVLDFLFGTIVGLFISPAAAVLIANFTVGINPDFGKKELTGVLVSAGHSGMIYKTYEGKILTGKDNTSDFSTTNPELYQMMLNLRGKKVNVSCDEWFVMPDKMGQSSCNLTSISGAEL